MNDYIFEGGLLHTAGNVQCLHSVSALYDAMKNETVLEAVCHMCDTERNLHMRLGEIQGIIPKEQSALGAEQGQVKEIALISKVGKPVQFIVRQIVKENGTFQATLSRKVVQQKCKDEYLDALIPGDIIRAKITHLERFGAFADIGAGIHALIPIDMLSVSRISHPRERVRVGEVIPCAVRSKAEGKITLSFRELLGDWEQNVACFQAGETVKGIVRSVESYGVFIELTPNLAGLAEYTDEVEIGQAVSVYIKSIIPEKMKIKLSIIDTFETGEWMPRKIFFTGAHMDVWRYHPEGCEKIIETKFS